MFPAVGVGTVLCSGGAWKKYSCNKNIKKLLVLKILTFQGKSQVPFKLTEMKSNQSWELMVFIVNFC